MISTKGSSNAEMEEREHRMSRMLDVETARQRLASEQLIKLLEVRPLNATAMLLTWKQQRKVNICFKILFNLTNVFRNLWLKAIISNGEDPRWPMTTVG